MGLKRAFARHASHKRRSLIKSSIAALAFFVVFTFTTLFLISHQRSQYQHEFEIRIEKFTVDYFDRLIEIMQQLMPLTDKSCPTAQDDLSYRAAFTSGVRTFVLVRNGIAYCSSAIGNMMLETPVLYPEVDWQKPLDLKLRQGTAFAPERPAIALWLQQPGAGNTGVLATLDLSLTPYLLLTAHQDDAQGLAIVMGKNALTTFSPNLMPVTQLPTTHASSLHIEKYPLTLRFYHQQLTADNIRFTVLGSLALSLLVSVLYYFLQILNQSPDRALRRGIKRNEFFVEYQPVYHSTTGSLAGLEALIRWQHPTEGRIPLELFIPYAESAGLIIPLTRHLFSLIVADTPQLVEILPKGAKISLNLAPSHLSVASFRDDILNLLAQFPREHLTLVVEITERGMVEEKNAKDEFDWLHRHSVEIAVDDFGTGHSALIYLQHFTLDYLKIDQGFVRFIGHDTVTVPVLDAVISLAKKLKMQTIAEGVETIEQVNFLRERGVNFLQGYYFSKPLNIEDLMAFCQATSE